MLRRLPELNPKAGMEICVWFAKVQNAVEVCQISWQATTSNCVSERGKPDIAIHSASFCNNVVQSQTFDW